MTRAELLARMSTKEYEYWRWLELVDPWGERREDYRIGLLASQIAAVFDSKKSTGGRFTAKDCMLWFEPEKALEELDEEDDPIEAEKQRRAHVGNLEAQLLAYAKKQAQSFKGGRIVQETTKPPKG